MTKENILVTGGAGFIASNLVDRLIEEGYTVAIVDNLSSGQKRNINPKAVFHEVDICDREKVSQVFREGSFAYVYHLAAQIDPRFSVSHPEFDNQVNVFGGLNVLQNCLDRHVKKIIFSSTGGAVYGDTEVVPTPETVIPSPVCPYGIHKLTFEKYLNYYYKVFGQPYTALRPANVYGPRQFHGGEAGVVSIFIDNAVNNRKSIINGNGEQTRDFVYVDDLMRAFIKAKDVEFNGEINIGTGQETNLLQIVEAIEKALSSKIDIEHGPSKPGEQLRSCLDASLAEKILGWKPEVDLEEGIKRTIAWSKSCL